jgi:serine/threonine-protein kinase
MSPEQARGQLDAIDFRTDVYGLAAILYEILTGLPPIRSTNILQLLRAVAHDAPDRPSELASGVPPRLEEICLKGLAKKPNDRQQTALELRDQVQNWMTEKAERRRTEQERERFFSLSLDLLVILDAEGAFHQVNPAVERILGWTVDEILKMSVSDIAHPDDRERTEVAIQRVFEGEHITEFEDRTHCKDGSYKWIQWSARLIEGEHLIYTVGRDITERKLAEQKFRGLLEAAPDVVVVVDPQGKIQLVNAQTERLFGFLRDELLGETVDKLMPERFRAGHPAKFSAFVDQPSARPMGAGFELFGRHKDGTEFPVEIAISPFETEEGMLYTSTIRELSDGRGR